MHVSELLPLFKQSRTAQVNQVVEFMYHGKFRHGTVDRVTPAVLTLCIDDTSYKSFKHADIIDYHRVR